MSSVGFANTTGVASGNGGSCASVTTKTNPAGVPTTGPGQLYNQKFSFNSSFASEWYVCLDFPHGKATDLLTTRHSGIHTKWCVIV